MESSVERLQAENEYLRERLAAAYEIMREMAHLIDDELAADRVRKERRRERLGHAS